MTDLRSFFERVKVCCSHEEGRRWDVCWEENGRRYKLERHLNEVGR